MRLHYSKKSTRNSHKIKVLIVDDHQLIIDGVKILLENDNAIEVVGEAHNGQEALNALEIQKVNIVLLDLNMPVMDGITTAKLIGKKFPRINIIILSMFADIDLIYKSIQRGVQSFVSKNKSKEDILKAIYAVYDGGLFVSDDVLRMIFDDIKDSRQSKLTTREIEVLRLIARGYTSKEIATKLFLSLSTINTHRRNLIEKTGALNSQSLIKYATDNGLI